VTNGQGSWQLYENENGLEIVGVHAVVLHTGKVLYWCFDKRAVGQLGKDNDYFQHFFNDPNLGSYQIWDPATKKPTSGAKDIGRNSFCAGQCALADGTIFVAGGQDGAGAADITGEWDKLFAALGGADRGALKDIHTYDPVSDTWTRWPDMADGRYYPTCQILGDGTAFVAGGLSNLMQWVFSGSRFCENDQFETVPPGELFAGPTPQQKFQSADQYPIIRLLPGSRKLFVHVETQTTIFDLDSSSFVDGAVFNPPATDALGQHVGRQTYPMQTGHVLLPQKEGEAPRILIVGGSTFDAVNFNAGIVGVGDFLQNAPAVLGAFIFEFNAASPPDSRWRATKNPPSTARLLADTVLLPDGTVFVVNGIKAGAAAGHSKATAFEAEIFDPDQETFTLVAPNPDCNHPRGYHSTAVLLPDASVAIAGNTDAYNPGEPNRHDDVTIQIYTPPYLSAGPRPVVTGVPTKAGYGSTIRVDTTGGPPVATAMMMRPCTVTHTVDMDQRAIRLQAKGGAGTLTIKLPTDRSLAPPGYYMLFFVSAAGVPSVASFVRVFDEAPTYPPINLGTYSGSGYMVIEEVFDGDVTLEKIDNGARVTLESRHGSITIKDKISDGDTYANLKAATTVSIGTKIDQGAQVQILAGGDVTIGQTIDQGSQATITSTSGKIDIGQKVDAGSSAYLTAGTTVHIGQTLDQHSTVTITAQGDVTIDEMIDQHATANITSAEGAISVGQKIQNGSFATLAAGTTVNIGRKLDQHAQVTITAQGDVQIGQKIDQHVTATITSAKGSIDIGQGLSGEATATLIALNGDINIGDSVDAGSTLNWNAQRLDCPHLDGTINHL
jgi:hypothetical protein